MASRTISVAAASFALHALPPAIVVEDSAGISITPSPATMGFTVPRLVLDQVIQSSLSITPSPATMGFATEAPSVLVATTLTPSPATMGFATAGPEISLGSISITPSPASLGFGAFGPADDPLPGVRGGDIRDRDMEMLAVYATTSHGDESHAASSQGRGGQMLWSEIHDHSGDSTLGTRFAAALTRLEGLCYAVWGSRPRYDRTPKQQWYERVHPRCIWFAEAWQQQAIYVGDDQAYDYSVANKEFAALGQTPFPQIFPTVPKRSRSGDPARQWHDRPHASALFPAGSVTRTAGTLQDPQSTTEFGETTPTPEDVTISYTAQPGITYVSVSLEYETRLPPGSWSGHSIEPMVLGSGVYTATIPAEAQGTECRWRIKADYLDPDDGPLTRYDPDGPDDGDTPTEDEQYSFTWWTHYNPYEHGFPEMLADYGPDSFNVRKGQDWYLFDGSETIQPALINLCRFILDELVQGRDTNGGRYASMQHSPRVRSSEPGDCCQYMPIRWRWSGSAPHPHYQRGGKGGTPVAGATVGVRPLHNASTEVPPSGESWGSQVARMTWRGIDMLYKDSEHFGNYYYGAGNSWDSPPNEYRIELGPEGDTAIVYEKRPEVGLQPDDVIDAVHIEEIIAAVDYLVNYGCWIEIPIYSRPRTPGTYLGRTCGFVRTRNYVSNSSGSREDVVEFIDYCQGCCADCDGSETTIYVDGEVVSSGGSGFCDPHPTPTWEECIAAASSAKCGLRTGRTRTCLEAGPDEFGEGGGVLEVETDGTSCNEGLGSMCGQGAAFAICEPATPYFYRSSCDTLVNGWSAFICGPAACQGGPDSTHGNGLVKLRYDHSNPLNVVSSGTPGFDSQGNCFGDLKQCGEDVAIGLPTDLWFGELIGHVFSGGARNWIGACTCSDPCDGVSSYPDVPGLLSWREECCDGDGNIVPCDLPNVHPCPICRRYVDGFGYPSVDCNCNLLSRVCRGDYAWAAIDLNLDGAGRPYATYAGRPSDPLDPYAGDRVPYLRPYDLDAADISSECPCETWTNAGACA